MVEIASWVPAGVKLGFHLCYGDANHAHFKAPDDKALMVRVMNHIATHVERPVDWFHLPDPLDREETGYFEPLTGHEAGDETAIYLGLLYDRDGADGAPRSAQQSSYT